MDTRLLTDNAFESQPVETVPPQQSSQGQQQPLMYDMPDQINRPKNVLLSESSNQNLDFSLSKLTEKERVLLPIIKTRQDNQWRGADRKHKVADQKILEKTRM